MIRRAAVVAAALVLGIGGAAALLVARMPSSASAPPVRPSAMAGLVAPAEEELTSGPLLASSPPVRLEVPALHVSAPVTRLGLQADGSMEVPSDTRTVGWFTGAPAPGALGPAVLAGHVDFRGEVGAFGRLDTLRGGDTVRVAREDGTVAEFVVSRVGRYPKKAFPTEAVYGPIDHAGLRLITCGGDFDRRTGHYVDNVVAFASLRGLA
ncbi:class F sortase [Actinoplanes ianthinogenes]|uniref:class F sortase n=1 Tax=Actinoplanes ianthinogenes TaxID=122358 RepID=UPI0019CDE2E5|nr:class F sortase [Actinoplanes ianthinogenes]GGR12900.1 class F sortase [Actinoplanes ianthinogenes]